MSAPVPIPLTAVAGAVRFPVRVMPRSSRTRVGGVRDGRLVVRVTAPPVDRAANDAAITALAQALRVPAGSLSIAVGASARNKTIQVHGLGVDVLADRLTSLCEAGR